jgi:4-hydroxybenzoate polyprenyltransferase
MATARTLVVHLRLPFQLLLAPIFLWGWLLAGGGLSARFALAFVAVHLFLYGGVTAFNSYYDRDAGPIGGLERPPPVVRELLPFAVAVQAIGWALAALVNLWFAAIYAVFVGLSFLYSHPRVRLKAHPWASLVTVAFGQGALAFAGAWAASRGDLRSLAGAEGLLGALAATLIVLGLYPLTQLYQVEEDRARGDRTIAVAWGARRCFVLALGCTALGGVAMLAVVGRLYGPGDGLLVGAGLAAQLAAVAWWARHFDLRRVLWNFRFVMRLNTASAATLAGYLGVKLLGGR